MLFRSGKQKLDYTNNSPDALDKVFYHLYFNAFQPGSMMDVRNQTLTDADPRVADRIAQLTKEEQGWIKVSSLKHDGANVLFETNESILEVTLAKPILPNSSTIFDMVWDAQVPIQIRRNGRSWFLGRDPAHFLPAHWPVDRLPCRGRWSGHPFPPILSKGSRPTLRYRWASCALPLEYVA